MKHTHFLQSLKILKSHLTKPHKKNQSLPSLQHTSPTKSYCTCIDSKGQSKYLYSTKEELAYILSQKKTKLTCYHCPYEKGWHITKS